MDNKTVDEHRIFCANLKKLRTTHNLSKSVISRLLEISPQTLTRLENGEIPKVSIKIFFRIYEHFRIEPKDQFKSLS